MSKRTAYLAAHDHIIGALVVELDGPDLYHLRHVEAEDDGSFIDLGERWSATGSRPVRAAALVPGDVHVGQTDAVVWRAVREIAALVRPERLVLHDLFDGRSITHHDEKHSIDRARNRAALTLRDEVRLVAEFLKANRDLAREVVVVKSNHDEFLDRYLQECRWRDDPANYRYALDLAAVLYDRGDPLRIAVEREGAPRATWLARDSDLRVAGVQLAAHGDLGANGARGTMAAIEQAYGAAIVGHAHSPEKLRGVTRTGTCTPLRLDYTEGPSSWLNSHAVLYPTGAVQLLTVVDGKWRRA